MFWGLPLQRSKPVGRLTGRPIRKVCGTQSRYTEVRKNSMTLRVDEDVGSFEVSVDDLAVVKIAYTLQYILQLE